MTNELVYEGKAKRLFKTEENGVLRVAYKDDATALNGVRKESFAGKGELNNQITSLIFSRLAEEGISSHFIRAISETEQLVKEVAIIPLEVVVRNVMAGSLAKRLGKEEGEVIPREIVEFYYKDDALDDPFINDDHVLYLDIATTSEMEKIRDAARSINEVLQKLFNQMNITLIDFKLEFGRDAAGQILLADEISPDTCRLWDKETNQKLDKDVFRRNIGNLTDVYTEVLNRLKQVQN
ncbi:phosphoribosylaminoimidazolesuccinocarboxamide synthase [Listeria swaminathanii]|uniref:Phosphoribosylaminoimidazole-succinocarboxamide synthase n=1 Tax=Listeria swaminathanii TaxID=2713501 RepID=A0ABU2IIH3_9LIST|nr:phosphoribosylaminoimidazolesuccinocarboxamide synthase [Listeria swaminathanii]MDT0018266.1 phosphoribosylaminoimidazolesuccinocarboxamide synthase [Listeria swaminathanii]MDT0023637.1 phosphoribosylaminoimidazolesuccinocarboxamide synthase [Listeria swaminathanii]MDT0034578.1 phosphoribosylaminoimidazolesuccinocarboxamide synthase [Listeria swaminathanii]MDT0053488.1 phosphoribosylaminoimidazolesuccinocarboxamide synthase [Listeria swaminathanii]MDT0056167.1 phosphoribosylaminoimidazolesu